MVEECQCRIYENLSNELQKIYPLAARSFDFILLMYNRLTLIDGLIHKDAVKKILENQNNIIDFEFSLPWKDVHQYMSLIFRVHGSFAKVRFNGRIDTQTGKSSPPPKEMKKKRVDFRIN
jgi:hypothetical protein